MVIEKEAGLAQKPELLVAAMDEVKLRSQAHDLIDWVLLISGLIGRGTHTGMTQLPHTRLKTVLLEHQTPRMAWETCLMACIRCLVLVQMVLVQVVLEFLLL